VGYARLSADGAILDVDLLLDIYTVNTSEMCFEVVRVGLAADIVLVVLVVLFAALLPPAPRSFGSKTTLVLQRVVSKIANVINDVRTKVRTHVPHRIRELTLVPGTFPRFVVILHVLLSVCM
jgi:hypothetical protein